MNHPSEWARYFDENTGSYRYKHKGSGVIRDTLMTIGKVLKKNKKTGEKEGQKRKPLSQGAKNKLENILQNKLPIKSDSVEKGSEKIWKILQERKKRKPLSQDAQTKLNRILVKKNLMKKKFFLLI